MEDNDNEDIHPEIKGENDARSDQKSEDEVILDYRTSEGTNIEESGSHRVNLKDRSTNIDDPTKGASNLGDCATNTNSTILSHLQSHDDKSGKNNGDVESVTTIVANTHTGKKDDFDHPQTQTGNNVWPEGEFLRILPSGNRT